METSDIVVILKVFEEFRMENRNIIFIWLKEKYHFFNIKEYLKGFC